jgi:N-acetylglucosaminyl-diphospho-decaprenol L-rhamnosyltransferase
VDANAQGLALSIIIVSYNSREDTLNCLRSVFAHPPSDSHEIILIDNASSDGSADAVAREFPGVRLIASKDNLGFAAGNNEAAKHAGGKRLLLLNPDTIVFAGSLDALMAFAERAPARRIWGGRTYFGDMTLNPASCWGHMTLWSMLCKTLGLTTLFPKSALFNSEAYGSWQRDTEREVDIVTGCFLLIDRDLWDRLGGFDRQFFMYAEEADLCIRARKLGARPAITPLAEIIHLGGVAEASATEKVIKTHKGRITLLRKHWSPAARILGLAIYTCWSFTRMIGSYVLSGPRDGSSGSREKWGRVWTSRKDWMAGYPAE